VAPIIWSYWWAVEALSGKTIFTNQCRKFMNIDISSCPEWWKISDLLNLKSTDSNHKSFSSSNRNAMRTFGSQITSDLWFSQRHL
jgi:hypothetical protein